MIASLLSEENRWVNGQRIEVSGGMALRRLSKFTRLRRSAILDGLKSPRPEAE
jgi:hypothetical protein